MIVSRGASAPVITLRGASAAPHPEGRIERDEEAETGRANARLACRACGRHLSDPAARFVMTGSSSTAVFVNPHGRVFEIVTLRDAWGLVLVGPPTSEFSWFPGYSWRVAVCGGCSTHLGWTFQAVVDSDPALFFGLLIAALVEVPDD